MDGIVIPFSLAAYAREALNRESERLCLKIRIRAELVDAGNLAAGFVLFDGSSGPLHAG
jgi:hypothetical protein